MVYDLIKELDILERIKSGDRDLDKEILNRKKILKEIEEQEIYEERQHLDI